MKRILLGLLLLLFATPAFAQLPVCSNGDMIYRGAVGYNCVGYSNVAGYFLKSNGAGGAPTWTSQAPNGFLLPTQSTNTFLGNTTGGNASPSPVTVSQIFDTIGYDIARTPSPGAIIYKSAVAPNNAWQSLAPGVAGQVLSTGGAANPPHWVAAASASLDSICAVQGSVLYRNATDWVCLPPATSGFLLSTGGAGANPSWIASSTIAVTLTVGSTAIASGTSNGMLFNNGGVLGNTVALANAILVTNGSSVPAFSTTVPAGVVPPRATVRVQRAFPASTTYGTATWAVYDPTNTLLCSAANSSGSLTTCINQAVALAFPYAIATTSSGYDFEIVGGDEPATGTGSNKGGAAASLDTTAMLQFPPIQGGKIRSGAITLSPGIIFDSCEMCDIDFSGAQLVADAHTTNEIALRFKPTQVTPFDPNFGVSPARAFFTTVVGRVRYDLSGHANANVDYFNLHIIEHNFEGVAAGGCGFLMDTPVAGKNMNNNTVKIDQLHGSATPATTFCHGTTTPGVGALLGGSRFYIGVALDSAGATNGFDEWGSNDEIHLTVNGLSTGYALKFESGACNNVAWVWSLSGTSTVTDASGCTGTSANTWYINGILHIGGATIASSSADVVMAAGGLKLGTQGSIQGSIQLNWAGGAAGTVITSASNGGSPVLQTPNTSGTLPSTATAPIVLNAITGAISCATCVTSSGGGAITGTAPIAVSASGVVSLSSPYAGSFTTLSASGAVAFGSGTPTSLQDLNLTTNSAAQTSLYVQNTNTAAVASIVTGNTALANYLQFLTFGTAAAGNRFTTLPAASLNELSAHGIFAIGTDNSNPLHFGTNNAVRMTLSAVGDLSLTSTGASAFAVGRQGATNPVLQVDASTTTVATGLKIKGAAAAGGLALSVITSGTNENLTVDAAGSGTITVGGTSTGAITLTRATTMSAALTYGGVTLSNAVTGTGNMVLATSPTLTTPILGVASATNLALTGSTVPANGVNLSAANTLSLYNNSLETLRLQPVASAVNYAYIKGAATGGGGNRVSYGAAGSDTDVSIDFIAQGAGNINFNARGSNAGGIMRLTSGTASASNGLNITSAASGSGPTIAATDLGGTGDSNIPVNLTPAGTSNVVISTSATLTGLATDVTHTDRTVCQDSTSKALFFGSGALGICLGTSGRQFKTAFVPMEAGINELMGIKFHNYRYLDGFGDNGARLQYGTTAQEVEAVMPDLVGHSKDGATINYDSGALLFVGLRAIQQLKADNDSLRLELEVIKSKMKRQK